MSEKILYTTLSNYFLLIMKIIFSLMLVRIMFLGITNEEYGFWALLWTVFGYSLLLDFGFGTAVQKETSKAKVKNCWQEYNKTISTIFFSYIFLSLVIILITIILAMNLQKLFVFSNVEDIVYYQRVFTIFGFGTALVFPFGFFKEILRGLEKIALRNIIDIIFVTLNFLLLSLCVYFELSLIYMAISAIVIQLLTNLFMCVYVYKNIPNLKISFLLFDKKRVKELMGFSFFAYIVMFSNLIIFRTDQLVISMFSTVALVGLYQIVSRVSELFRQFSTQIHDILGPLSARLFTSSKHDDLSMVLLNTNKIVGFIATILLIPSLLFIEELLFFWLKIENKLLINTAIVLLVSMYVLVFFRSSSVQVLLMCEKHKQLTLIAIIEAVANLLLSIYLIKNYSILGVALGTLIPNLCLAFLYNIPVACSFSKVSIFDYLYHTIGKTFFVGIVVLIGFYFVFENVEVQNIFELLFFASCSMFVFMGVYWVVCLTKQEKEALKRLFKNSILNKLKLFNVINV